VVPQLFVPPADHPLRPHVAAIFRMRARGAYRQSTILPTSTVDILFNLGDRILGRGVANGGAPLELTRTRVAGVQTGPLLSWPGPLRSWPGGEVHLIGVSLRVERCAELLPVPLSELTNASLDAAAVIPGIELVREQLWHAAGFREQVTILLDWLIGMRRADDARAAAVRWACGQLQRGSSAASVSRVAADLAVSARHLRRLFGDHIGVSPAAYARLRRFTDALQIIRTSRTLTDVAYRARYFDQAHFTRDFKAFAGMTPQTYTRAISPVPGRLFAP
jgi:AraC-like DNA-binding protein